VGRASLPTREKAKKAEMEKQTAVEKAKKAETERKAAEAEKKAALEKAKKAETEKQAALSAKLFALEKLAQAEAEKQAALEKAGKLAKLQIAKQMLQANVDIVLIMQVTGLKKAEISGFHDGV